MSSAVSPGLSISNQPPVVICDLDGTLLSVNSFPVWVRYLIYGHFGELATLERLKIAFATIKVMFERKLLKKDHAVTKAQLQQLWERATSKDTDGIGPEWLLSDLAATTRPNLSKLLQMITANRFSAVLATAAAAEYAVPLGQKLGFKHILATPKLNAANAAALHNVGAVKRDCTLAFLQAQGWDTQPRIFLTDHEEDLPLIAVCDKILWFGKAAGLATMQTAHPDKVFVNALLLDAKEIVQELTLAPSPAIA